MKHTRILIVAVLFSLVGFAASAQAQTTRYACAAAPSNAGVSGTACGSPAGPQYQSINSALNASSCGDTVKLKANEVYSEHVVLPVLSGCSAANPVTITSTTPDSSFPAAGYRICNPATNPALRDTAVAACISAYKALMPQLNNRVSGPTDNNNPTITTANGAKGFYIKHLWLLPNPQGYGDLMQIGKDDTTQQFVADQPEDITLDQVVVTGDPVAGQKRGAALNGKNLTVKNSAFWDIKALGQDSNAIACFDGTGPITVTNNWLEAAAENIICGGAGVEMRTFLNTAAGSTTTTIQFDMATIRAGHTLGDLAIGQFISCYDGTSRQFSYVQSKGASSVTIFPAFPSSIAAGLDCRWGKIPDGITITRNYLTKNYAWRNNILSAPSTASATPSTAAGSLAAGTYCYQVVAIAASYIGNTVNSAGTQQQCATLDATGQVTLNWTAVTNATGYRVYGRSSGTPTGYLSASGGGTVTLTDTGSALTTGTIPTSAAATIWQEKNDLELKAGTNVLIEGNILDGSWQQADTLGALTWIKSANQDGSTEFIQTKNVTFRYNVLMHGGSCMESTSQERASTAWGAEGRPGFLENFVFSNNLCFDTGLPYLKSSNTGVYAIRFSDNKILGLTFSHNTMMHSVKGAIEFTGGVPYTNTTAIDNNLFMLLSNGVKAFGPAGYVAEGNTSLTLQGVTSFLNNAVANNSAPANAYPASTIRVPVADWQSAFGDYQGNNPADYKLVAGHAWNTAASDGTMIGADIPTLLLKIQGVPEGVPTGSPVFLTTSLTPATQSAPYSVTLATSGGSGARTCSLVSGSLPSGVALTGSTCTVAGTPASAGTATFTLRLTDSLSASTDQPFSLVVNAASAVVFSAPTLPNATVNSPYAQRLSATGGTSAYQWTVVLGLLPPGITLDSVTGDLAGKPTVSGIYSFSVQVKSGVQTASQPIVLTVVTPSGTGSTGGQPTGPLRLTSWNGQQMLTSTDCTVLDSPRGTPNTTCASTRSGTSRW
jgi:hypothetical protein